VLGKKPDGTLQNFGERGNTWDHSPLYEEVAAIPLLIAAPGIGAGTYGGVSSAVDVMPTVLDILGQPIPEWVDGQSLLPAMRDAATAGREFTVSTEPFANPGDEVRSVDDQRRVLYRGQATTVTTDRHALIYSIEPGRSELYDLNCDARQESNVIHTNVSLARELHGTLLRFMEETGAASHLVESRRELRV
jgi:arylsulfatase A-like enzyme